MIAMRWKLIPLFTGESDKPVEILRVLQYRESRRHNMGDVMEENFDGVEWSDVKEVHEDG